MKTLCVPRSPHTQGHPLLPVVVRARCPSLCPPCALDPRTHPAMVALVGGGESIVVWEIQGVGVRVGVAQGAAGVPSTAAKKKVLVGTGGWK